MRAADDPSGVGAEHPTVTRAFTPAKLQEIRAATAVTLQRAAESLIVAGKPLNFNVPRVGLRGFEPVIGTGKGVGRDTAPIGSKMAHEMGPSPQQYKAS